jgi:hypothetical protein
MFSHKLQFGIYNNSIQFRRALTLHFTSDSYKIEGDVLYFNMTEKTYNFLSDWGLELVAEKFI